MRILITQPAQEAAVSARALAARGHEPIVIPLVTIERESTPNINLTSAQGFLAVSAEGVRALADHVGVRTFPIFVDSDLTAAEARRAGFKEVLAAKDDSQDLARLVERTLKPANGALIYACSTTAPVNLSAMLGNMGFAVRSLALYSVKRVADIPRELRAKLDEKGIDAALFLSPDEARAFVTLMQRDETAPPVTNLKTVAATPAIAAPLRALKGASVTVAPASDPDSVWATFDDELIDRVEEERRARERQVKEEEAGRRAEEERLRQENEERERLAREKAEAERIAREHAEAERQRMVKEEAERAELERLAREEERRIRAEEERRRKEEAERERTEKLAREKAEKERLAAERAAAEAADRERLRKEKEERERVRAEEDARARAGRERLAAERAAREEAERKRLAAERVERERLKAEEAARVKAEKDRLAAQRAAAEAEERERARKEKEERERLRAEEEARIHLEKERLAAERAEQERLRREQEGRERVARAEQERLRREQEGRERAERERLAAEQAAHEKAEREQRVREKAARDEAERQRLAAERAAWEEAERVRRAAEKAERDRLETERLERERIAREESERLRAENARIAAEREKERREQDRIGRENAERERAESARIAAEREKERLERERVVREDAERAREEKERLAREKAETERIARAQRAEEERVEKEKRAEAVRREKERRAQEKAERDRVKAEQTAQEAERKRIAKEETAAQKARDEHARREEAAKARAEEERLAQEVAERRRLEKEEAARAQAERKRLAADLKAQANADKARRAADRKQASGWFTGLFGKPAAPAPESRPDPRWNMAISHDPASETPPLAVASAAPSWNDTPMTDPVRNTSETPLPPTGTDAAAVPSALQELDELVARENRETPSAADSLADAKPAARSGGGRSAQMLAEDAADDRMRDRLANWGRGETGEPAPPTQDAEPQADPILETASPPPVRRRGPGRSIALFFILATIATAAMMTSHRWLPLLVNEPPASVASAPAPQVKPAPPVAAPSAPASTTAPVPSAPAPPAPQPASPAPATPAGTSPIGAESNQTIAALMARVATLEAALGNTARLDEINQRVDSLAGRSADANSVLALADRVAALEQAGRNAADARAVAVALTIAATQWRDAVVMGRPFLKEWDTVKALNGQGQNDAVFAKYASTGLPTLAEMQRRFDIVAAAAIRASYLPNDTAPWLRRTLDRVLSVVTVRRTDVDTGDEIEPILVRAERAADGGNLAGAAAELKKLTGASLTAASAWIELAEARVAAEEAAQESVIAGATTLGQPAAAPAAAPVPKAE